VRGNGPHRLQRRAARHHVRRPPSRYAYHYGQPPRRKSLVQTILKWVLICLVIMIFFVPFMGVSIFGILFILVIIYLLMQRKKETPQRTPYPEPRFERYTQSSQTELPIRQRTTYPYRQRTAPSIPAYIYPETPQYISPSPFRCFSCSEPLSFEDKFCVRCGMLVSRCKICRGIIAFGDSLSKCPHCENEFHTEHIGEWLKISGECPVCRERITQTSLITVTHPPMKDKSATFSPKK